MRPLRQTANAQQPALGRCHSVMWCARTLSAAMVLVVAAVASGDEFDRPLAAILKVGPQGAGAVEARTACDALSRGGPELLPRLLRAIDTDNPLAANWYRQAFEAIAARELAKASPQVPVEELRVFVSDASHAGRVRRLALAVCDRLTPGFAESLIPRLLDDLEFRDDAVEAALAAGARALTAGDSEAARAEFHTAFDHARESGQLLRAANQLARLGEQVDTAAQLGLVVDWWLVGPFDAPGFSGFAATFPPEDSVELTAHYTGQEGRDIGWVRHHAADPLGLVNLVQAVAPAKEAVSYAYARIEAPAELDCELRSGADDNATVWLNGRKVFGRNQWLNGIRLDRFTEKVHLQRGPNDVLVKVCQGPQHKDPQVPNNWSLQLRFCDATGRGVQFRSLLEPIIQGAP